MKTEKTTGSYDSFELFTCMDIPENPKAAVVIVHGICEHLGRYDSLAAGLLAQGFAVYRFDHRGHGRTGGERGYLNNFNQLADDTNFMVELARKETGLPVFVIGHSMGGFTAACWGAKYPGQAAGIVLLGALTHDVNQVFAGVPAGVDVHAPIPNQLTDAICRVPEIRSAYAEDPLCLKAFTIGLAYTLKDGVAWVAENAAKFADPVLVLHGESDMIISKQDSFQFFDKISSEDKQLKIYGKCFHEIFNEYCRDEVISDVIHWLENRI